MTMEEFVKIFMDSFREKLPKEEHLPFLVKKESQLAYNKLIDFFNEHQHSQAPLEDFIPAIQTMFNERLKKIILRDGSFQISPFSRANYLYAQLAKLLAKPLGMHAYNLLMPDVSLTDLHYLASPYEFIIIEREGKYIPIFIIDYVEKYFNQSELRFTLTPKEEKLVLQHSEYVENYLQAILTAAPENVLSEKKGQLCNAIRKSNYPIKATYGREAEIAFAKEIVLMTSNKHDLLLILSEYIPFHEWNESIKNISNINLTNMFFNLNSKVFNDTSLYTFEAALNEEINQLNKRLALLGVLWNYLLEKEEKNKQLAQQYPNLMRLFNSINMTDLLIEIKAKQNNIFKERLLLRLRSDIKKCETPLLREEIGRFENEASMFNTLLTIFSTQQKIAGFKRLSKGDFFALGLILNLKKIQSVPEKESFNEYLFQEANIKRKELKSSFFPLTEGNYISAYFLLLADVYYRIRQAKPEYMLGFSGEVKLKATVFFKQQLMSELRIGELNFSLLNDNQLDDSSLSQVGAALNDGLLGRIVDVALKYEEWLDLLPLTPTHSKTYTNDECQEKLEGTIFNTLPNWENELLIVLNTLPEINRTTFLNDSYSIKKTEEANLYLLKYRLKKVSNLNELINILCEISTTDWIKGITFIDRVKLLCLVLNIDIDHFKQTTNNDLLKMKNFLMTEFKLKFDALMQHPPQFNSEKHFKAYYFCLADSYERQRGLGSEFASTSAKFASFVTNVPDKNAKILSCQDFKGFIVNDKYRFSEAGLRAYLRFFNTNNWEQSWAIHQSKQDMLGKLVHYSFQYHATLMKQFQNKEEEPSASTQQTDNQFPFGWY